MGSSPSPDAPAPPGVFAALPRARGRAEKAAVWLLCAGWAAAAVGCLVDAPAPPVGDRAPVGACTEAGATVLRADLDGDGRRDRVEDPGRDGHALSVTFHGDGWTATVPASQARTPWQRLSGVGRDTHTTAAVGDFDGDGHPDLALMSSIEDVGDDSARWMPVHEVRYGPLRHDLTSPRTRVLHMHPYSVFAARAGDLDGDGRAELTVWQSGGDGVQQRAFGRQRGGDVTMERDPDGTFREQGTRPVYPRRSGWEGLARCGG